MNVRFSKLNGDETTCFDAAAGDIHLYVTARM